MLIKIILTITNAKAITPYIEPTTIPVVVFFVSQVSSLVLFRSQTIPIIAVTTITPASTVANHQFFDITLS